MATRKQLKNVFFFFFHYEKGLKLEEELDDDNKRYQLEKEGDYELFVLDRPNKTKLLKLAKNLPIDLKMRLAETLVECEEDSFT